MIKEDINMDMGFGVWKKCSAGGNGNAKNHARPEYMVRFHAGALS